MRAVARFMLSLGVALALIRPLLRSLSHFFHSSLFFSYSSRISSFVSLVGTDQMTPIRTGGRAERGAHR